MALRDQPARVLLVAAPAFAGGLLALLGAWHRLLQLLSPESSHIFAASLVFLGFMALPWLLALLSSPTLFFVWRREWRWAGAQLAGVMVGAALWLATVYIDSPLLVHGT